MNRQQPFEVLMVYRDSNICSEEGRQASAFRQDLLRFPNSQRNYLAAKNFWSSQVIRRFATSEFFTFNSSDF
jgi:hypothetical protein